MPKETRPPDVGRLPVPVETIERRIYLIRGLKVMLDFDLAELYRVPTKRLNEAVKRNVSRFPEDFMFKLSKAELEIGGRKLRLQSGCQDGAAPTSPRLHRIS